MKHKKSLATLTTATAVAALTLTLAGTATADLTTRCVGEGGAVTVPGNLVVPNGQTCVLDGTVIQGDVRVGNDADLIAENVTVEGRVTVRTNGYLEAYDSEIGEKVVMRGSFGSFLESSSVEGDVIARPGTEAEAGFVFTEGVTASGDVRVTGGELLLDGSDVAGDVRAIDGIYADLYDTFMDGQLRSVANEQGSVVCRSAIQGEARFIDNDVTVQLGGATDLVTCDGSSYWGSDVRVVGTLGDTFLDNNIANGDVTLRNNDPVAVLGAGNLVRGNLIGEFELASPAPAASKLAASKQASSDVAPKVARSLADRSADIERRVEDRRSDAIAEAAAAGDAF